VSVKPTRRFVVSGLLAAGGGLSLGFRLDAARGQRARSGERRQARNQPPARFEINAWIVVQSDETVIVRLARSEMGQGALTGLAQLAAEELDCDWANVRAEVVPPDESLRRGGPWGDFSTGSSRSIRSGEGRVRRAALAVRLMLLEAAAARLGVPADELTTGGGTVLHVPTGRSVTYGQVAQAAADLPTPMTNSRPLREPAEWRIAGQPLPALDQADKVTGATQFGIDVTLPGMRHAAIRSAPSPGGKLAAFDGAVAESMPGVHSVLAVGDDAVAVVADGWWQASRALDKVAVTWAPVAESGISSESIDRFLKTGLETTEAFVGRTHGDSLAALRSGSQTI
jgi:isoquinoline 1-oxidoreductase beta subunit